MASTYGHFDDAQREYVITEPLLPFPWINYLGNTRLTGFISQQAGGLVFHREPQSRRITRYYWLPAPPDRPGFYVYVKDRDRGLLWNPHFAPTNTRLDTYECRHGLGYTQFTGSHDDIKVTVRHSIPPADDVFLWDVRIESQSDEPRRLRLASYVEFGILEFMRELFWCYLKNQISFDFQPDHNWIRYLSHVFEAPFAPAIFFSCTRRVTGYECSRDAFCGQGGSLERPQALLAPSLSNSQLPGGGHGCGVLAVDVDLAPRASDRFAYLLGVAEDWNAAASLCEGYADLAAVDRATADIGSYWQRKTGAFQVSSGEAHLDRMVNVWNPLNCQITLERTRDISTDHVGADGMRYRDTMQDALAVANFDPEFSRERIRLIFSAQARDGGGCFSFYPYSPDWKVNVSPVRSDNTVWPIFTVANWVNETGDLTFFDEGVPFRDGGEATVYEHLRLGLRYIAERRGPHGLPLLFHADWNDGLAVFRDEHAESVMLGIQLVHAGRLFAEFARRLGRNPDADWCEALADELAEILNSDVAWDGEWYRRLLLRNGMKIGSRQRPQGQIYLEPQVWAVIAGVADAQRGRQAMDAVHARLNTPRGLLVCAPPYTGIPNPEDPLTSNVPGSGENGGIFCHANTWAIIAECLLGNAERAFTYYRQLLPCVAAEDVGHQHWGREPYVFTSTVLGPARGPDFGKAGISWLTGTASWMYVAATQYLLGIQPAIEGLRIRPCWPARLGPVQVTRSFRGKNYQIEIQTDPAQVRVNGQPLVGDLVRA